MSVAYGTWRTHAFYDIDQRVFYTTDSASTDLNALRE